MDFDKNKVYTALNADELKVGSKVIVANFLESLKSQVEANSYPTYVVELSRIMGTSSTNRFGADNKTFNLAYLVSEPEKNWIVYLHRGVNSYYLTACRNDAWEYVQEQNHAKTKLFEGTEDECEKWYEARRHFANDIEAWEDGKIIQYNSGYGWEDCCDNKPAWDVKSQYRIKPEGLKWTDLKIGDIVQNENLTRSMMVIGIDYKEGAISHIFTGAEWLTEEDLKDWEKVE